jgi:hemerythrin
MKWDQRFSVNIKVIDEQHKKWIGMLNNLHDAMRLGKGRDMVGSVLGELVDYTKVHFSTEERLMEKYGYALYSGHKKLHEDMVREVELLQSKYEAGETTLTIDVMQFLKNWLSEHIIGTDRNYAPFLNGKGVS